MPRLRPLLQALGLALVVLAAGACFGVYITENCRDADSAFRDANRQIERLEAAHPFRHGRAHQLCLLVFDRQDSDLIRVEIPLWLAQTCLDLGAAPHDRDFDFEGRYGIDWREFRDLGRFGPGLLVAVDDEQSRVLVWLR